MRFFYLLIIFFLFHAGSEAQKPTISNVSVSQDVSNRWYFINYTLSDDADSVSVLIRSKTTGEIFPNFSLRGDIGKNISKGEKKIVWYILQDNISPNDYQFSFSVDYFDKKSYNDCYNEIKNQINECNQRFDIEKRNYYKKQTLKSTLWSAGGLATAATGVVIYNNLRNDAYSLIKLSNQSDITETAYNNAVDKYNQKLKIKPLSSILIGTGSAIIAYGIVRMMTKKFKGITCQINQDCQTVISVPWPTKKSKL